MGQIMVMKTGPDPVSDSSQKYKISHHLLVGKYGRENEYFSEKVQILSGGVQFKCSETGKKMILFGSLTVKEL